jgi:hypothetical protein
MKPKFHTDPNKDLLIKAGAGLVLVWLGNKLLKNLKKDQTESQVESDPTVGHAQGLRQAMNPSGNEWMRKMDGTNTEAIFTIAKDITDLPTVAKRYKALYVKPIVGGRASLYEDLQGELSASDYQKFLSLATKGKAGSHNYAPKRDDIPANNWIITKAQTNIRKTPIKESKYLPGNNIVKLVELGKLLGITTGKFVFDESNDVVFVEFWTYNPKKEKKVFYVAKSQIEIISNDEKKKRETKEKIPLEILQGIDSDSSPQQEVISIETIEIYNENFNHIATAPKGMIIGFPIMTLDTGKGTYIKVTTVQGLLRWVKAEKAVIKNRNL